MRAGVVWKEGMEFDGSVGEHLVRMDSRPPLGKDKGATPKELVALGLGGCTAMDVVALLKKHKQPIESFRIEIDIQPTKGPHPIVFEKALLSFIVEGAISTEILLETVRLSQTKYCGVSAMLSKAFPIEYEIILNGQVVGAGKSNFESNSNA